MIIQLTALGLLVFAAPVRNQQTPSTLDWDKAANEIRRMQPGANFFNSFKERSITQCVNYAGSY